MCTNVAEIKNDSINVIENNKKIRYLNIFNKCYNLETVIKIFFIFFFRTHR